MSTNKIDNGKRGIVVLLITWAVSLIYTSSYLFGYNWFPISQGIERVCEPIYEWLFGGVS